MQRFGAKGPGTSVYFRDPDGSLMEFMSYSSSFRPSRVKNETTETAND